MKKILLLSALLVTTAIAKADDLGNHVQIGTGLLYERGWDATLSYEHETRYHNAWEYFANVYLKWEDCESCGHICPESFWDSYNTWELGVTYKPCVKRARNHHGNFRLGGAVGSDRHEVLGGVHVGYEHTYSLKRGWQLFWQVKTELMINGLDTFRSGVVIGVKIPTKR